MWARPRARAISPSGAPWRPRSSAWLPGAPRENLQVVAASTGALCLVHPEVGALAQLELVAAVVGIGCGPDAYAHLHEAILESDGHCVRGDHFLEHFRGRGRSRAVQDQSELVPADPPARVAF